MDYSQQANLYHSQTGSTVWTINDFNSYESNLEWGLNSGFAIPHQISFFQDPQDPLNTAKLK